MFEFLTSLLFLFFLFFAVSLSFFGVCVVCDEHLVPTIEVFIDQFHIPEDVAGVTLVAFGSAAPELILNLIAAVEGSSDLSLPAVLGSALIAFGLIPPLIILCTENEEVGLTVWPIMREAGFYLLGLVTFLYSIEDGVLTFQEALAITFVYVLYVGSVVGSYLWSISNSTNQIKSSNNQSVKRWNDGMDEDIGTSGSSSSSMMTMLSAGRVGLRPVDDECEDNEGKEVEKGSEDEGNEADDKDKLVSLRSRQQEDVEPVGLPQSLSFQRG